MKKPNWAAWVDNKPKYKKGDIVLISDGFSNSYVTQILEVKIKAATKEQRKSHEEHISRQRQCCGNDGRGVRSDSNIITYLTLHNKTIYEREIQCVGIDEINEHIKSLYKQISDYSEQVSKAAEALGYNDNW